jgi:hypothetical protein
MVFRRLKKMDQRTEVTVLVYVIFAAIGIIVMLTGAYLVAEELFDIAKGTRGFSVPSMVSVLEFGWPFVLGMVIWLAGALIRLIMTGVRAFPLRLGRAPEETVEYY